MFMKRILVVLLIFTMLAAGMIASGSSIELPDIPIDSTPVCNVTTPDDYIYDLTFNVKSALAKDLKKVIPEELTGYADSKKVYYITVELNEEQYKQIAKECGENIHLCNVKLNDKDVKVFKYKNDKDIIRQFNILMPSQASVLTLDYFGDLKVTLNYRNKTIQNTVHYVEPNGELELPYPEVNGKTPIIWNAMSDGSGRPYDQFLYYTPASGKLWTKDDNTITIYAIWDKYDPVMQGDVNNDSQINNKDVVDLFRIVSSSIKVDYLYRYDVNGDNVVNNKDVTVLFRLVSED